VTLLAWSRPADVIHTPFHLPQSWCQYVISFNPKHSTGNDIRLGTERNTKGETANTATWLQIPFAHYKSFGRAARVRDRIFATLA